MARVESHFADGWQNKKASEKVADGIHKSGLDHSEVNKSVANKMMEGISHQRNADPSTTAATSSQQASTVHAPVERQIPHDSARQSQRPEMQTEGAVNQAREQFQKVKNEAKNLESLVSSRSDARTPQAATQSAVSNASQATQTNLQQNAQGAATFTPPQTAAGRVAQQQQRAHVEASLRNTQQARPDERQVTTLPLEHIDAQAVVHEAPVVPAAPQSAPATSREGARTGSRKQAGGESRARSSASAAAPGAARGSTTDQMSRLMGGQSSFSGSGDEGGETAAPPAQPVELSTIPEGDPALQVFNEFDSTQPGIETLLSKRNLLERHVIKSVVEKRVAEIAALDESVGSKLQDIFAARPLSERIVGDIEVTLHEFHRGVYGGLIG